MESLDTMRGGVVSLVKETGEINWYAQLGGMVKGSPGVSGDRVAAATLTGKVVCLDLESGEMVWEFQLDNPLERWIYHGVRVIEGGVIAGSARHLVKLDLVSGRAVWERRDLGGSDWICSPIAPVFGDGRLFMGFFWQPTGLVALDFETGRDLWRHEAKAGFACPSGTPLFRNGRLYVARHSVPAQLQCVDAAAGEVLWSTGIGDHWVAAPVLGVGGGW